MVDGGADIATVAIVHLLKDDNEHTHASAFAAADFILAQSVADTYPCRFVQTHTLRSRYGAKVLTWPNLTSVATILSSCTCAALIVSPYVVP